jgi:disulfide bond formation protein DsbB
MEWWVLFKRYVAIRKLIRECKPLVMALFATFSLLGAYYVQYKWHIMPCQLCIYQRYVLMAVITLSLFSSLLSFLYPLARLALWCSFCLNTYQIGVEQKWWSAPAFCHRSIESKGNTMNDKMSAVLNSIQSNAQSMPPCDKITWKIHGIPATLWFEGALILVLLWTKR